MLIFTLHQGIVGANPDNEFDILGVAPNATLYAYRVFGCEGQVADDGMCSIDFELFWTNLPLP